jgi:putative ABC transport system permease protein
MRWLRAALRRGVRSILARPGRAALTAFGVGIGVAATLQWLGVSAPEPESRQGPPARMRRLMVSNGARESLAAVWAATPDDARRAGLRAVEGRLLGDPDVRDARRVAVLGAGLRAELFGFRSALLEPIEIGGSRFTVVGVLEPRPLEGERAGAPDPNRAVLLPASATTGPLAAALAQSPGAPAPASRGHAAAWLGALATCSLLLGAAALGNAMLATALERTREIALRRAVGATRAEVFGELLLESVLVSTLGGAAVALALQPAAWSAFVALALAALVGTAAGLPPALRAVRLDPARALRCG